MPTSLVAPWCGSCACHTTAPQCIAIPLGGLTDLATGRGQHRGSRKVERYSPHPRTSFCKRRILLPSATALLDQIGNRVTAERALLGRDLGLAGGQSAHLTLHSGVHGCLP
eukprot:365078-Chlamydomonas_euryale.AAC.2